MITVIITSTVIVQIIRIFISMTVKIIIIIIMITMLMTIIINTEKLAEDMMLRK